MILRRLSHVLTELGSLKAALGPPAGLRILMYHAVGTALPGDALGLSVDPKAFEAQMTALKEDARFEKVPIGAAGGPDFRGAAVTFDDGYRDNLTTAAPILAKLGVPFTVFVVPAYVQGGSPYYLSRAELKELSKVPGCTIGSHGMNHKALTRVSFQEAQAELRDSRAWLEDALGRPVKTLSYPYGLANRAVRGLAEEAGYGLACCSRTGVNAASRDTLMLCRTEISAEDSLRRFRQKLAGAWDWHAYRRRDPATI